MRTPDALEETVPLGESVQGVIALGSRSHEPAEGVDLVLSGVASVLVDLADADLDAGVVLGLDDAVGGAALAWDVAKEINELEISCFFLRVTFRGATKGKEIVDFFLFSSAACVFRFLVCNLQIDNLSLFVLHGC